MAKAVIAKLSALYPLSEDDIAYLREAIRGATVTPAGGDIAHQEDRSSVVRVILHGEAYRYKVLPDGKRQIIGFLVPGDFCDPFTFLLDRMDHSIAARTRCEVAELGEAEMLAMMARPALARALWLSSLVDGSILREWLVNVARRPADRRVAHILCELHLRLLTVGEATQDTFRLSLSQTELADTVGLTIVSVNRALQYLRRAGLIAQTSREIRMPDVSALRAFANFDPDYLHLRAAPETGRGTFAG